MTTAIRSFFRFSRMFSRCSMLALALISSGCANINDNLQAAPQNVSPQTELAAELPPYRVQIGDVLEVKMLLNPEFDQEIIVRPDGMISTVLAQNVPAYGKTPLDIEQSLRDAYRKQLSNPQLSIIVKSFTPTRVYVMGEVNSPGEFVSVGPNLTLMQALARAGGVKLTADTAHVTILRRGAADQPQALRANADEAMSGVNPAADVRLAAYDVVYVPRTGVAELNKGFNQYIQQFLPPTFGLSYSLN